MDKVIINNFDEFEKYVGLEIGVSPWHTITQEQINMFADATLDHQWIHTDQNRAKNESPFGTTIAHGYLSLSIVPFLWDQIIQVNNLKMLVNYGIEKLRFVSPVPVDSRVRLRAHLKSLTNLRGIAKSEVHIKLEIENVKKPAFDAVVVFLYTFNN